MDRVQVVNFGKPIVEISELGCPVARTRDGCRTDRASRETVAPPFFGKEIAQETTQGFESLFS